MEWLGQLASMSWLEPGRLPQLTALALVAVVIAVDTLPVVGLAVPGDIAVIGVVTVVGICAGPSVILAVTAGSMTGWSLGYLLGRTVGRRRPGRSGRGWFWRQLGGVSRILDGRGVRVLALAPFLPVVNALAPVAAGLAGVGFRRTLAFAAVGSAGWASLYTLIGMGGQVGIAGLAGLNASPLASLLPVVVAVPISAAATLVARRALRPAVRLG